jgi:hypothetical protein
MKSLCICEGAIRSSGPNRIGPYDHSDGLPVTGDGHFLASDHPVKDLGQRGPRLAGGHRRHTRIVQSRTPTYNNGSMPPRRWTQHLDAGGGVSMLTVAPRHQAGERLAPMKAQLTDAYADTMRSRPMQTVMEEHGMVGSAKVFECICGENGFHPHLHVLLFHAKFLDVTYGEEREFVHTFWRVLNEQLAKWAGKACRHPKAAVAGVRYSKTTGPSGRRKATYVPVTNAEWYGLDPNRTRDADLLHGINFVPITRDGDGGQGVAAYVGKIQLEMTRGRGSQRS